MSPKPPAPPGLIALPLLVGMAAMAVYLLTAAPTFYWLDSGELAAASWELGIAHPPGHPLALLLSRPFCYLPLGSLAFRVTLASAAQAAFASALVTAMTRRAADRVVAGMRGARPSHAAVAAVVSGLTAALCFGWWFNAVRTEVYALHLLTSLASLYLLLRWNETPANRGLLFAAAFLWALGVSNHHLLALLIAPALLLFVALRVRHLVTPLRAAFGVAASVTLGLVPLVYLPLRAQRAPSVDWGSPTTLDRLWWVLSAALFQRTVGRVAQEAGPVERATTTLFALLGELGPAMAPLALLGLYLVLRRKETRPAGMLLALAALGTLASPLLVGFDPANPDAYGYLALATGLMAVAAGCALTLLLALLARWSPPRLLLACLPLVLIIPLRQGWINLRRADLRGHWAAEETGRHLLDQPSGALVLTSYFQSVFSTWALRSLGDLRPDLTLLHRNFLGMPGHLAHLAAHRPELYRWARRWPTPTALVPAELRALSLRRPLRLEADLNLPPSLQPELHPDGLVLAYGHPPQEGIHQQKVRRWQTALGELSEPETRRAALWVHYLLARFACAKGLPEILRFHLRAATRLAPEDRRLRALRRACSPST